MQNLGFLFFLVFVFPVSAQHTSLTQEDFNKDGVEDYLKCTYEIGSNFGGGDCELVDGKTQNKFTLTNYGCYCAIKKHVFIAPTLRKKENEYFLYALKKEILPEFRPTPDQSLYWIIKSGLHSQKPDNHPNFDLIFTPQTTWRQGEPEAPYTYSIEIKAATLDKITSNSNGALFKSKSSDHKDFLVYYGDTHFSDPNAATKDFISIQKNEYLKYHHPLISIEF